MHFYGDGKSTLTSLDSWLVCSGDWNWGSMAGIFSIGVNTGENFGSRLE